MTSLPLLLSHAATFALPKTFVLMALSRSPTVSLPVDVYVVVLVPSLTVIVPFARIPSVNSEALAVSGAVPVPTAGEPKVTEEREEPEAVEPEDEDEEAVEPPDDDDVPPALLEPPEPPCKALCTADVSWLLTRFRAV